MIKKYKTYKLLTLHDKILNRFNLESTIFKTKSLPIVEIYEIIKNIKYLNISDEQIILITIYILMDRLNIDLETKGKIGIGLDVSIVKKINIVLNVILTVSNITLKDTTVISGFVKLFDFKNIHTILSKINEYVIINKLCIDDFPHIIEDKKQKVLKDIIYFIS